MANTLDDIMPRLVSLGIAKTLRKNTITPRLVNRDLDGVGSQQGATINVSIPVAGGLRDVAPAEVPPAPPNKVQKSVPVTLDYWKESVFYMTDKDLVLVSEGIIPQDAEEALKTLVESVDSYLLSKMYQAAYQVVGTAGTTPFDPTGSVPLRNATDARELLVTNGFPTSDLYMMLNPAAENNAINLQAFQDASRSGTDKTIMKGQIGEKVGLNWVTNANMPSHTAGTAAAATVTTAVANAAGATTVTLKVASSTAVAALGDVITFAGHTQTYIVRAAATLNTTGVAVTISPPLAVAVDGSSTPVAVTFKATHKNSLAFHKNAVAFATRPFSDLSMKLGRELAAPSQIGIDPISGLAFRLEVTRQNKQIQWAWDILCGGAVIRPEGIVNVFG